MTEGAKVGLQGLAGFVMLGLCCIILERGCRGPASSHEVVMWPDGKPAVMLQHCYQESCLKEAALACPRGYIFIGTPPKDNIPNDYPGSALRCEDRKNASP